MVARILVVEDDATTAEMLQLYLEKEGYAVTVAHDGITGLAAAQTGEVDLILLDLMLPGLSGWQVCRQVRAQSEIPIILVTALDQEAQKVEGLHLGADDYITKPFSMKELLARIEARLRRPARSPEVDRETLIYPGLVIDAARQTVTKDGKPVILTPKEFLLLYELAGRPGRVITHGELNTRVWNYPSDSDDHTLRTHMQRLRHKLEQGGCRYLHTVWGSGYKFEVLPK